MKLYRETRQFGIVSAVLGTFGMAAWLIPVLGLLVSLPAIILGFYALDSSRDGYAIAGIALGLLSLILTVLRSGLVYFYG